MTLRYVLPQSCRAELQILERDARQADRRAAAQAGQKLSAYLWLLNANGWPKSAIAEPLVMGNEAVRLRILRAPLIPSDQLPPVPVFVRRQPPVKPRSARLTVRPEVAQQLREMYAVARTVNGVVRSDDPRRAVSLELSAALASLNEQGVSVYALAKACGVTLCAIKFRLARHGYRPGPPSQNFTYHGRAWFEHAAS